MPSPLDIAIGNAIIAVGFTALVAPVVVQMWPWDFLGRPRKKRREPT